MSTVPVIGTRRARSSPGQKVEVTFYLNGKPARAADGQGEQGQRRQRRLPRPDRDRRRPASTRPAPSHAATARARRRQHRAQELAGQLPRPAPGPVRRGRRRLQEGDAEDGLHRQQRPLLRRQDRARRPRLPQSQRHGAQLRGPARAWSSAPSPAAAATRSATRAPASTSRCRSPSRSWSSPRATSRSRSTRSPPASPRPRRSPATSPSSGTEPGYNSHGMYYSFYFYGGYAVHGYDSVPDYPASHGCIRTFIADQPRDLRTDQLRREHLRLLRELRPAVIGERALKAILASSSPPTTSSPGCSRCSRPDTFFDQIGHYGVENSHYVGDVGAFLLAFGVALGDRRRAARVAGAAALAGGALVRLPRDQPRLRHRRSEERGARLDRHAADRLRRARRRLAGAGLGTACERRGAEPGGRA